MVFRYDEDGEVTSGCTRLMVVSYLGLENLVQLLLRENVDVDNGALTTWDFEVGLHFAIRGVHENVVRLLLEKGADPQPSLTYALLKFRFALSKYFKRPAIATSDKAVVSGLYDAINVEVWRIARPILEKRAITTHRDTSGQTAQDEASLCEYKDLTRLLIERSNDPRLVQLRNSEPPSHIKEVLDSITIIGLLSVYGAKLETRDPSLKILIPDTREILSEDGPA